MPQVTIEQAMQIALQHHRAGRLRQAEEIYRQVLVGQPEHFDAMHNLGLVAQQLGRKDLAVELLSRAIALAPDHADAHYNLGVALQDQGRLDEAITAYRRAICLRPARFEAHNNLGNALKDIGQLDDAIAALGQAIAIRPDYAQAHGNLGNALKDKGQLDQAIDAYRRAIVLKPNYAEAHNNLGAALKDKGQLDEAIAEYHQAIDLRPDYASAYCNLGTALKEKGQLDQALAACRRAIALRPDFPEALCNLGNALTDKGQLDEAAAAFNRAIALRPGYAEARYNLGICLKDKGQLDEAIASFREAIAPRPNYAESISNLAAALQETGQVDQAIAAFRQAIGLRPGHAATHSNLLLTLHYHADCDARTIAEEHHRWELLHAGPLKDQIPAHANDRSRDRRLRIGYVSPDFRGHPVGRFLLPLLEHHDHRNFEIFGYCDVAKPDGTTARLRSHCDRWLQIGRLDERQVAMQVVADQIDILVDLAGHTDGNRLRVFARKPAPVQVSYLGYPGDTGLPAIDYRLSDGFADPVDSTDQFHAQTVFRLPQTNWCFAGTHEPLPAGQPPVVHRGTVTFGCFNNIAKVTEAMLRAWATVLHQVPGSRLLLKATGLGTASARQRVRAALAASGIDAGRLDLRGPTPDAVSHLGLYREVDVALDTFPYHGTTTTCEALWMGVPVVTLAGNTHVSRVGVSLLNNIGLPELVAATLDQYIGVAVALAEDPQRLGMLRTSLRERMSRSPLMDAPSFARDIESAYRQMWHTWCERGGGR